jgi:hypothetical protein
MLNLSFQILRFREWAAAEVDTEEAVATEMAVATVEVAMDVKEVETETEEEVEAAVVAVAAAVDAVAHRVVEVSAAVATTRGSSTTPQRPDRNGLNLTNIFASLLVLLIIISSQIMHRNKIYSKQKNCYRLFLFFDF